MKKKGIYTNIVTSILAGILLIVAGILFVGANDGVLTVANTAKEVFTLDYLKATYQGYLMAVVGVILVIMGILVWKNLKATEISPKRDFKAIVKLHLANLAVIGNLIYIGIVFGREIFTAIPVYLFVLEVILAIVALTTYFNILVYFISRRAKRKTKGEKKVAKAKKEKVKKLKKTKTKATATETTAATTETKPTFMNFKKIK